MLATCARRLAGFSPGFCLLLAAFAAGCGGDDELGCVEVPATCTPLYPPTFEQIFTRTLQPTCGVAGGACHSAQGAKAGLVFAEPDAAHALLLGEVDGRARVIPGEPACSILVARIATRSRSLVMPPGGGLGAGEQCAIIQWVAGGAAR
jgi:hypothetical protein